jgi:hypothetical protein
MNIKHVVAFAFVAVCLLAPSRAEAQLEGAWDVTFELPDSSPTVTFEFTPFLIFFTATTDAPENCSWFGLDLALQGSSSAAIGFMTCEQLGDATDFIGLMFNTRDKRTMNGVVLTASIFPPFASFTGQVQ